MHIQREEKEEEVKENNPRLPDSTMQVTVSYGHHSFEQKRFKNQDTDDFQNAQIN